MKIKLKALICAMCCNIAFNNCGHSMLNNNINQFQINQMFINNNQRFINGMQQLINQNQQNINQLFSTRYKPLLDNLDNIEYCINSNVTGLHKGIPNIGNTCYSNAALQLMVGQPSFAKQFIRHVKNKYKYKNILQYTPHDILTLEFANIIANLWAYNNINIPNFMDKFTALTFKNALGCTNWQFANFNPNDAKDVFIQLCNSLHSALSSNHNIKPCYTSPNREECLKNITEDYMSQRKLSPVFNYFYYILENNFFCNNCNLPIIYTFQPANFYIVDLKQVHDMKYNNQLPVNYEQHPVNLIDCFNEQIQREQIQNFQYNMTLQCPKCRNSINNAKRKTSFIYTPEILPIIINRGKNNLYKIPLEVPETIDLKNYVTHLQNESKYLLSSILYWIGDQNYGHFITIGRTAVGNKWYKYNDNDVSEFDKNKVKQILENKYYEDNSGNKIRVWPYMLCYTKIHENTQNNVINNNMNHNSNFNNININYNNIKNNNINNNQFNNNNNFINNNNINNINLNNINNDMHNFNVINNNLNNFNNNPNNVFNNIIGVNQNNIIMNNNQFNNNNNFVNNHNININNFGNK